MVHNQISEKERHLIIEYVNLTNDKLVWVGRPTRQDVPPTRFFFTATLVLLSALTGLITFPVMLFSGTLNYDYLFIERGIFHVVIWLGSLGIIYFYLYYDKSWQNMIYGITERKVFWLSKGLKVELHELPFTDIIKTDLVGRLDLPNLFTIYFTPSKRLNFYGYNYENHTTRPFPTFELIYNGDQVFQQLNNVMTAYNIRKNKDEIVY